MVLGRCDVANEGKEVVLECHGVATRVVLAVWSSRYVAIDSMYPPSNTLHAEGVACPPVCGWQTVETVTWHVWGLRQQLAAI